MVMPGIRALVRSAGEAVLCGSGAVQAVRTIRPNGTTILAYHNIVPDGEVIVGDRSLHLQAAAFRRQMETLARTHDVVPLECVASPASHRPRAAITLDDATVGALTAGVEVLRDLGLPATIFVAPDFVEGGAFWWDELADPLVGLDPLVRAQALDHLRGERDAVLAWAESHGWPVHPVPEHQRCASVDQLAAAERTPGLTLAPHSWSHPNLTALEDETLALELSRPLAWLREYFTDVLPWIAYPYGLVSPAVQRAAMEAGYVAGLRVDGGKLPVLERLDPYALPRLNIAAGVSDRGFVLRMAGVVQ
jgi:peptidoglycan/xylan/chitin deacetylase (PgdA/CDA1 family)